MSKENSKIAYIRASVEFEAIKREGYTRQTYPPEWNAIYKPEDLDSLFMMYAEYNKQLRRKNYLEFDDQIKYVEKLHELNPHLFEELGYEHIVVDEFQDTDLPQIKLLQKMCDTTCFKSLMCVGDDSQSIFGFRHTSSEYMVNFKDYFGNYGYRGIAGVDDLKLTDNHRSTGLIVSLANKTNDLANVKVDKELVSTKPAGIPPEIQGFYSKKQEYAWIADEIASRWKNGERSIACIMSTRDQLTAMASELTKRGIPSVLKSPVPMMSNSRVRALISFYDSYMGRTRQGFADYQNVLAHGEMRNFTASQIEEVAERFKADVFSKERTKANFLAFANALDLEQKDECYQKFLERFDGLEDMSEVSDVLENFKLYGMHEDFRREGRYEGVNLTTVHSSKGLEWDTTYLCVDKIDEMKFHERRTRSTYDYDEGVHKLYVGQTRAKENLIITGEYLLGIKNDKRAGTSQIIYNNFLAKLYEFTGRQINQEFSWVEYCEVKAREEAEKKVNNVKEQIGELPKNYAEEVKNKNSAPPAEIEIS